MSSTVTHKVLDILFRQGGTTEFLRQLQHGDLRICGSSTSTSLATLHDNGNARQPCLRWLLSPCSLLRGRSALMAQPVPAILNIYHHLVTSQQLNKKNIASRPPRCSPPCKRGGNSAGEHCQRLK
eukprot:TRINITY_DN32998_c0_g1_i1.p1 TRINITY_DN32998_c0_g1~~TRINITY_DN32998_c0_g1_i1.p1  ORF type:complete len:125 (+),score=1.08 TRINITY_DN32998_c0_g1_i1:285-659(+)